MVVDRPVATDFGCVDKGDHSVWHTMLNRLDVPVGESFQDSPGIIQDLLA